MGLLNGNGGKGRKQSAPIFLASGRVLAHVHNVNVTTDSETSEALYAVTFRIDDEISSEGGDDPSQGLNLATFKRLDGLSVPDLTKNFDSADEGDIAALAGLFGTPTPSGPWGEGPDAHPGLVKWNGKPGTAGRFDGAVEVTFTVNPPRERREGGWWNPKYAVTDIDKPGASDGAATAGAALLAARLRGKSAQPATTTAQPAPQPAQGRKRAGG